jgi:hypothetical protein
MKVQLRTNVSARAAKALATVLRFRLVMVISFGEWVRVGVIYNYNTNSEASPNPKNVHGALQALERSIRCRE